MYASGLDDVPLASCASARSCSALQRLPRFTRRRIERCLRSATAYHPSPLHRHREARSSADRAAGYDASGRLESPLEGRLSLSEVQRLAVASSASMRAPWLTTQNGAAGDFGIAARDGCWS